MIGRKRGDALFAELFGGSLRAILYALDMLITFLFLRKDWQKLRP